MRTCSEYRRQSYYTIDHREEILELPKSLEKRLEILVNKALEKGSRDNITIIAAVYLDIPENKQPQENDGGTL